MHIDRKSYMPKCIQVKENIIKQIEDGILRPHEKLMSIREIACTCNICESTVKKTLGELVHDGYIYPINGKGHFVCEPKRKVKTLAVVLPHLSLVAEKGGNSNEALYDCIPIQLHYIEHEAFARGWNVQLYIYNNNAEKAVQCFEDIRQAKADGAITFYPPDQSINALNNLRDSGVSTVFIDTYLEGLGIGYVSTDNYAGAYEVTSKLVELGYEKVFYVTHHHKNIPIMARYQGYADAMRDHDIQPDVDVITETKILVAYEGHTRELYRGIARRMFDASKKPFAVFTVFPSMAHLLYRAIEDIGCDPTGVAIACYDEPWMFRDDRITLLKVIQPLEEMARRCVDIVERGASDCVLLKPRVVVGWDGSGCSVNEACVSLTHCGN
ncbi:MAG: GntR family transcriptional regulator [Armatimonadota bacterium]|nr:GntR family transcriptional regulator [bacterium]